MTLGRGSTREGAGSTRGVGNSAKADTGSVTGSIGEGDGATEGDTGSSVARTGSTREGVRSIGRDDSPVKEGAGSTHEDGS